ncbi:hypothetical protein LOY43_16630 [Pseudomonas sp. B21-041]|uniref:hypothetical protein n=1 Tax=Pseudomonas sp. B21-041 TaxID=2895487 RepID=UPI00215FE9CD|nr:hypothetical protein [Pseudomonas sp. B21-041]UVL32598.1 hypothetical protein LOY43_16630 [Pseudomonas sp. B21-041]
MSQQLLKGSAAEETVRNYFLSIGYFVVRGCKFKYNQFDITDIDLFIYGKSSAFGRERLNVDIKNKKTPQAIERIFWAKGLQQVLGLDGCMVATTDLRPDVREFGLEHKVKVLDGRFLTRLNKSERSHLARINEEDLVSEIEKHSLGKLGGDWRGRYESSKSRILDSLNFDGANAWLNDIDYYMSEINNHSDSAPTWRMIYISVSHLLICIDFILREHVAAEHDQRKQLLDNGFRYGSAGKSFTLKVGKMASALVGSVVTQPGLSQTLERELADQASDVKADVLAEFFSKSQVFASLFDSAKLFEGYGYQADVPLPSSLPAHAQSYLGVVADFLIAIGKKF